MPSIKFNITHRSALIDNIHQVWSIPSRWEEIPSAHMVEIIEAVRTFDWAFITSLLLPKKISDRLPLKHYQQIYPHLKWMEQRPLVTPPVEYFEVEKSNLNIEGIKFSSPKESTTEHFYLPGKFLVNVKMLEMELGFAHFARFVNTKNSVHLDKLLAVFCRPRNPAFTVMDYEKNADVRMPFNPEISASIAGKFDQLDDTIKSAFLSFFSTCLEKIYSLPDYKILFPKSEGKSDENPKLSPNMWRTFVYRVAEIGVAGSTINQVRDQYFHEVLQVAAQAKKDAKERERKLEQLRQKNQ